MDDVDTLYEQLRDHRITSGIERLKEELGKPTKVDVADTIASDLADLDRLISVHQTCAGLIAAHLNRMNAQDL
jgi:hypothetical protein